MSDRKQIVKGKDRWIKWHNFRYAIFQPEILFSSIVAVLLFVMLYNQADKVIVATFTVLFSICTTTLGMFLNKNWEELNQEDRLESRGIISVRNLKLLLMNIDSLDHRAQEYLERCGDDGNDLYLTYLEEIILRCNWLEVAVMSAIQNWTDIIPNAEIKDYVDNVKILIEEKETLSLEIKEKEDVINGLQLESEERTELFQEVETLREKLRLVMQSDLSRITFPDMTHDGSPSSNIPFPSGGTITQSSKWFSSSPWSFERELNSPSRHNTEDYVHLAHPMPGNTIVDPDIIITTETEISDSTPSTNDTEE